MTTGEKIAALRKKNNMTQEQLAEVLGVARQSVSRWEMDVAFPETEKLIKLSKLWDCSIDFLLSDAPLMQGKAKEAHSVKELCRFIRECGYFFLATSNEDAPHLRPMGMIYADDEALYLATDKRKNVYRELVGNPQVEIASYSLSSRKWARIAGRVMVESSLKIKEDMSEMYPMLHQEYAGEEEVFLVIFKVNIESVNVY